ncbi:F-box/kelch-repeat protein At1g57790-like isoform X1 [Papaver somniferum]|uniref:F-box/kelch-repeat protein At1g57790-like isoform X1 n=1 Tax=Papaver somniferum TaxID=3469 RepID=UPI000E705815|nr:F-box/kelch-repeat protein At1g57790-like isoform X1 [Papaver somniferum]XP_026453640.1 F-box/kelch-repeat protein At1g57790-like isoform X1 [Papaver somniferum]
MVELIADYLHPLDYVHFRSVCKANREIMPVVKPTFTSATQIIETTCLSPWLVFSRDDNFTVYNFVNPVHNENYLMKFPELLLGATIRYQKGGWLLLSREEELSFYNPFTRETMDLPDFPGRYHMSDISLSSLPTSSDCIIFAIERSHYGISIFCIRRGKQECDEFEFDNACTEKFPAILNTPVLFNGVFYSVGYDGTVGQFNLGDGTWKPLEKPGKQFNDSYPSYLVEFGEDLLLVKLGYLEMPVRIFRLDFSDMEWVKFESLGRYMLFVSDITCFSAVAPVSRMENKVYFPRLCMNGEGVLFYSLKTGSYQSFGTQHFAKNFCGTEGWLGNCTWI